MLSGGGRKLKLLADNSINKGYVIKTLVFSIWQTHSGRGISGGKQLLSESSRLLRLLSRGKGSNGKVGERLSVVGCRQAY